MNNVSIKTEGLRKTFNGFVAVENLSVEIFKGEIFGLLGPNGAGKTTSIRMITGLLMPDSGQVLFDGHPAADLTQRHQVGVCPQELVLWNNLTCREQLVFMASMYNVPAKVAKKRADELLEQLGLSDKKNALARNLSGGMQRRMNILMALMHDPAIVILDEPEAGLDPQSRIMVREFIRSMARSKTIIFTTHNMDEADRICDRIAIMDHGKVLCTDTSEQLKANTGSGDKLEIALTGNPPDLVPLKKIVPDTTLLDTLLVLRSGTIINKIPAILDALAAQDARINGMQLRETSLEDVFIALTGRRLRE
jgi:ABC-2 type transport system ATP-binding protein